MTCSVCFMELSTNGTSSIALKCSHNFCSECLITYLKHQITNGKSLSKIINVNINSY